jgi:hypothetical protein
LSGLIDGFCQKVVLQALFPQGARAPILLNTLSHVIDLKSELVLLTDSSGIQALRLARSLTNLQLLPLIANRSYARDGRRGWRM